jgi:hypothetical protein
MTDSEVRELLEELYQECYDNEARTVQSDAYFTRGAHRTPLSAEELHSRVLRRQDNNGRYVLLDAAVEMSRLRRSAS